MRNIRTGEEKFNIIMESLNSNETIAEICRRYNIAPSLFYKWKDEFFEGAKQRKLSRKQKGSMNRKEARVKLARISNHISNRNYKKNSVGGNQKSQ